MGKLALGRRVGENIFIGEGASQIEIMVVKIERGQVRLAIDAPRELLISRGELRERASGRCIVCGGYPTLQDTEMCVVCCTGEASSILDG